MVDITPCNLNYKEGHNVNAEDLMSFVELVALYANDAECNGQRESDERCY